MKLNEHAAISAPSLLLVPYEAHHVPTYHQWMEDPKIQEATASEPLTLEEEYENQQSWRTSTDKLTFIICTPLPSSPQFPVTTVPDDADIPSKMIGDVNLFLYPSEDDFSSEAAPPIPKEVVGEVDIMIASPEHRGKGLGEKAVRAFVGYIWEKRREITKEYISDKMEDGAEQGSVEAPKLKMLMAKIGEGNECSIKLFRDKLGWEQEGERNYFGELKFVLRDVEGFVRKGEEGVEGVRRWLLSSVGTEYPQPLDIYTTRDKKPRTTNQAHTFIDLSQDIKHLLKHDASKWSQDDYCHRRLSAVPALFSLQAVASYIILPYATRGCVLLPDPSTGAGRTTTVCQMTSYIYHFLCNMIQVCIQNFILVVCGGEMAHNVAFSHKDPEWKIKEYSSGGLWSNKEA
ncbi:GNAT domain-containing protein, partial [Triangularia setosa]